MGKLATTPGANLAIKINAAHRAAYGNAQKAIEQAAECGRLLIEAKELVGHGEWLPWLEAHTEVGPRQCQKYMQIANSWSLIEGKYDSESHLGLTDALRLIAKSKRPPCCGPLIGELRKVEPADSDELPNTGCNYDPADPRSWYKDEDTKRVRRRAWLNMSYSAQEMADSFLAEGGHRAIAVADADEIDKEILAASHQALGAWLKVHEALLKKAGATLPRGGRSEVAVDDQKK